MFEEPKYPFLYFTLDVFDNIILASGQEEPIYGNEKIPGVPNGRLYCRFAHQREKLGAELSLGEVNYKEVELIKADPLGIAKVDVGDTHSAGTISLRPVARIEDTSATEPLSPRNVNATFVDDSIL